MATVTGQLNVGEISWATDFVKTDMESWTVVAAGTNLDIISVSARTAKLNVAAHSFDVRDTSGKKLIEDMPIHSTAPINLGPFGPGARPRFNGLVLDTPTNTTTTEISYAVVYRVV
jgi:hypothetical protein